MGTAPNPGGSDKLAREYRMTIAQIQLSETLNLTSAMVDDRVNEGKGDKVSIYYKDHAFSYNDILQLANRTGNALKDLGIEIEDRVAILLPDCPEWIASFFGTMKIGAVAVPFNTMLRAEEYRYFLNDSRAKAIIVSSDLVRYGGYITDMKGTCGEIVTRKVPRA